MKERLKWIKLGEVGIDDYYLKYSDGRIVPWPTEKELEKLAEMYPMPPEEESEKE